LKGLKENDGLNWLKVSV